MNRINAAVIGMGIGQKHLDAIDGYKKSKVKIICEQNKKNIFQLKKKYPGKKIITDAKKIFLDKSVNLISIASYDDTHYKYVLESIKTNKNIIVEKPLCLTINQLRNIYRNLKKIHKLKFFKSSITRKRFFFKN